MKPMENKQTAVEWLVEKIQHANPSFKFDALMRQAKQMEKEQMKNCYDYGSLSLLSTGHGDTFEQYYNENYKSE